MVVVVGEEAVKPSLLSTTRSDAWQKTRGVDDADIIPLQQSLMGELPRLTFVFSCVKSYWDSDVIYVNYLEHA